MRLPVQPRLRCSTRYRDKRHCAACVFMARSSGYAHCLTADLQTLQQACYSHGSVGNALSRFTYSSLSNTRFSFSIS